VAATPASAAIETVVVTAERHAENIQAVPIAVTAVTGQDLHEKQIQSFRDLQMHVPSVTYTKHNFGGAQFQIRGISVPLTLGAAISYNQDDIYIEAPNLVTGDYFDVDRVEILRGPQSTSFGRAGTGGAVDVHTSKPNLDAFAATANIDYGTYNTLKPEVMVNVPIIEGELGVRVALYGDFHSGYEKNIYNGPQLYPNSRPGTRADSLGYSDGRFSVRWEPSSDTTIDLVADTFYERDSRVRGDKQLCHRDPSGVVGCLPDRLGNDPVNQFASYFGMEGSTLNSAQLGAFVSTNLALFNPLIQNGPGSGFTDGLGHPITLPKDVLTVDTPFTPYTKTSGGIYYMNWDQKITDWLGAEVDAGYTAGYQRLQQAFNNSPPENIGALIANAQTNFHDFAGAFHGVPTFAAAPYETAYFGSVPAATPFPTLLTFPGPGIPISQFTPQMPVIGFQSPTLNAAAINFNANLPAMSATPHYGLLPISNVYYNGELNSYSGIIDNTHGVLTYSPYSLSYDEEAFHIREWTGEARFNTNFEGPFQAHAGAFFMSTNFRNQYWDVANSQDYDAIVTGALSGNFFQHINGLVGAMPALDAEFRNYSLTSQSAFIEGEYQIFDDLKVTAGARFNDERFHDEIFSPFGYLGSVQGAGVLGTNLVGAPAPIPLGAVPTGLSPTPFFLPTNPINPSCNPAAPTATAGAQVTPVPISGGCLSFAPIGTTTVNRGTPIVDPLFTLGKPNFRNDGWSGRFVVEWNPKLSFTDSTHIYLSASRGFLGGGVNDGVDPNLGLPPTFKPAVVDALELGAKNTLLDDTLTMNLDVWYYDYQNYQLPGSASRVTSTFNVPAHLYGAEGEWFWAPDDHWQFGANLSLTGSEIGTAYAVDPRNPTAGDPNYILIKDTTTGVNCTVVRTSSAVGNSTPGDVTFMTATGLQGHRVTGFFQAGATQAQNAVLTSAASTPAQLFATSQAVNSQDAAVGIPWVNFGSCAQTRTNITNLAAAGFEYSLAFNPKTGAVVPGPNVTLPPGSPGFPLGYTGPTQVTSGAGKPVNLKGNNLPQVPMAQVGVNAQYTWNLDNGYTLVPRVDYYWQSRNYANAFNDNIDRIGSWDVMNAQIQLNAPEDKWYARFFAKNIFDKRNPTGAYVAPSGYALFTNQFVEDPRVVGMSFGTHW
jgi:outer membrane receptor protein involved in Fe transport